MTQSHRIGRILVPMDGSENSRHAAEHAVRLAQPNTELVFLYVVDEQMAVELGAHAALDGEEAARQRLAEQGHTCLRDIARLAEEHGLVHREQVLHGDPGALIAETGAREGVDLIVMGKIGRRGARRILMGSITRRVIESSDRPVLVVPGPPLDAQGEPL